MGRQSRQKRDARRSQPPARDHDAGPRPGRVSPAPEPDLPPQPWGDLWRAHRTPLVVIAVVALAVRAALLAEIAHTPYLDVSNIDSDSYHKWALDILKDGWLPTRGFYQSPLYAYFLAILYRLFGTGPWAPRVAQILIGSASPVVLYIVGATLFSRRVAWVSGLTLAIYGPLILEEITLSKTTLLVFAALVSFAAYLRAGPRAKLGGLAVAGFFMGVAVVGVAQWLLAFLALGAYAALLPRRAALDRRLLAAAVFLVAGIVPISPVVAWNSAHGGGLVLTSGGAGLNLFSGNNPMASGLPARPKGLRDIPEYEEEDARRLAERDTGHSLTPAEVSAYWSRRATDFMKQQPSAFLELLRKKFVVVWNGYEIPDNYHYTFMRTQFLPLLWVCPTFSVIAPLALLGLFMPFWRRRALVALYLVCFLYLGTLVVFYVRSRYRLPAVPFLILFAAVALEQIVDVIQRRDWRRCGWWAGALAVSVVFTNHQYCEAPHDGLPSVCLGGDTWYDQEWMKLAAWYQEHGDEDRAVAYLERALECRAPRGLGQVHFWLAGLEGARAAALVQRDRRDDATPHFQQAERSYRACIAAGYRLAATWIGLGNLYGAMGMREQAIDGLEHGLEAGAKDRPASLALARHYGALGRCGDAERVLARADREQGSSGYSDETRAILASCQPR